MLRVLTSITFVYVPREDRIAVAINAGRADAWSCWLTRRLALAVLQRATEYLVSTSDLAQRAPAEFRSEAVAFEPAASIAPSSSASCKCSTPPSCRQNWLAAPATGQASPPFPADTKPARH